MMYLAQYYGGIAYIFNRYLVLCNYRSKESSPQWSLRF